MLYKPEVLVTFLRFSSMKVIVTPSCPTLVAYQAPPSMGFSRQERWSGLPFPSPGDLPDPGIEPRSPALQAEGLTSEPSGKLLIKSPQVRIQLLGGTHLLCHPLSGKAICVHAKSLQTLCDPMEVTH